MIAETCGQLLRRYRSRAELTQEQLAEQSGYSTDYISKLERDQRLPPRSALDRLAEVLELGDGERAAWHAARERQRTPAADGTTTFVAPPVLPALPVAPTRLIGRVQELAAIHDALAASRLVTLTGVGGTGKTRLAGHVALEAVARGDFADGVAFVDLAPVRDPSLISLTVARSLGLQEQPALPPEPQLMAVLRHRNLLLVVDNLEHLVEGTPLLSRLLAGAPGLHILATSRVPLHLYGEHEVRVPPLALPSSPAAPRAEDSPGSGYSRASGAGYRSTLQANERRSGDGAPSLDSVESEAVQLFVERARAVVPGFTPTGTTLAAVVAICSALDGLPLALELAAARINVFPPEAMLPRLGDRLSLLAGGPRDRPARQQTLRAALDWSYSLLGPQDRTLFVRLGVFAGSFDAAAAAAIDGAAGTMDLDGEPLPTGRDDGGDRMVTRLIELAEGSLVEILPGPVPRFRLLETVRAYARAHLTEAGMLEEVGDRHLSYCRRLAEHLAETLRGGEQIASVARLDDEHDNLRAALDWAVDHGPVDEGLRLAGVLGEFWRLRGYMREGLGRLEALLTTAAAVSDSVSPSVRAQALTTAGSLTWRLGDFARATALLTEALQLAREADDGIRVARALDVLGNAVYRHGNYEQAITLHQEALALRRQMGDALGTTKALGNLGRALFQQGDTAQAQTLLEETLLLKRELGDIHGIAATLTSLGRIAVRRGDHVRAAALFEESLALKHTLGDRLGRVTALVQLGSVALLQGDGARAAVLLQEALQLGLEIGARDRVAEALESLAAVATADGRPETAARLGGAAESLRAALHLPLSRDQQVVHDRLVTAARAALGENDFADAWAAGLAAPLEATITEALEQPDRELRE